MKTKFIVSWTSRKHDANTAEGARLQFIETWADIMEHYLGEDPELLKPENRETFNYVAAVSHHAATKQFDGIAPTMAETDAELITFRWEYSYLLEDLPAEAEAA